MKVRVKLFGTLSQAVPDYQPGQGIEVELPGAATVRDLLELLGLLESQGVVIMAEARILKDDAVIQGEVPLNVMQTISGG
jgi:sulfur carrier protein ThiS